MTIVEFLTARYNEIQRWTEKTTTDWPTEAVKVYNEVYSIALPVMDHDKPESRDIRVRREDAEHIVRNGRQAVLDDIAAKKKVLIACLWALTDPQVQSDPQVGAAFSMRARLARTVLEGMASPFKDHHDFRKTWTP